MKHLFAILLASAMVFAFAGDSTITSFAIRDYSHSMFFLLFIRTHRAPLVPSAGFSFLSYHTCCVQCQ